MKVTSLHEVRIEDQVALLRDALKHAEAGELLHLMIVSIRKQEGFVSYWTTGASTIEKLGILARAMQLVTDPRTEVSGIDDDEGDEGA